MGRAPSVLPLLRGEAGIFARSARTQLFFRPVLEVVSLLRGPDVPDALLAARHAVHIVPCRQSARAHLSARHADRAGGDAQPQHDLFHRARGVCNDAPTSSPSISLSSSRPSSSSDEAELRFIAATPLW